MGSLCVKTIKGMSTDVKVKQIRALLTTIVRSQSADSEVKTLTVRLLLRLGYAFASAENMLLAADLQAEMQLDITWDLMPLLDKSEKMRKYIPPSSGSSDGDPYGFKEVSCPQGRVTFTGSTDNTVTYD